MHNDTPLKLGRAVSRSASLISGLAILVVIVAVAAPRATPFMLLLLGGSIVALGTITAGVLPLRPLPTLVHALVALGVYLTLNSLWSVVPLSALGRVLLFALIVAMGLAVARALPMLTREDADRLQLTIVCAVALTALLLAIETQFGQPLRRVVVSLIPALQPSPKHMTVGSGWVAHISLYTLNRNVALLNVMLWPTLLLLARRLRGALAWSVVGAILVFTAAATFNSEHETSKIAFVIGCLVLVGMLWAASVTRTLITAAWVAATLLVVPAANFAHEAGLHRAEWLPVTARNRIVLWNVTADRMLASPILGIGIESTKPLDKEAAPDAPREPGDTYSQRTGRHAHNIFMQIWYELGATGALLFLIVGIVALRAMAHLPSGDQPYVFASFASTMALASFSWGLWQPWFMCAFGLWAVFLMIALDASRRSRDEPSPEIAAME